MAPISDSHALSSGTLQRRARRCDLVCGMGRHGCGSAVAITRGGRRLPPRLSRFNRCRSRAVHLNDVFWAPRIETNRTATIPAAFKQCELSGRVDNFIRAAKALRGEPFENKRPPGYPFDDTDVYKVIEGASYTLSVQPDPKLDAYVDGLIAKIAAAQETDGYLYTARTINPKHPHPLVRHAPVGARARRQSRALRPRAPLRGGGRALPGHGQAHAARHRDQERESAGRDLRPGQAVDLAGPPDRGDGSRALYRVTGDERYLALAKFMLDERGPRPAREDEPARARIQPGTTAVIEQASRSGTPSAPCTCIRGWPMSPRSPETRRTCKAIDTIWATRSARSCT